MEILQFLWHVVTTPLYLLPFMWPAYLIILMSALVFAVITRARLIRAVGKDRVHQVMQSPIGWPVFVVGWTVALLWVFISIGMIALTLILLIVGSS